MSSVSHLYHLLDWQVPAWLALLTFAGLAISFMQTVRLARRVDRHARSIGHMDDWADVVETRLEEFDGRIANAAADPAATGRPLTDEQVRAVVSLLGRATSRQAA